MNERGWNAYQHEVKAILAGRQTMFRRVMKVQPEDRCPVTGLPDIRREPYGVCSVESCPFGQPGDRLYLKETWRVNRVGILSHGTEGRQIEIEFPVSDGYTTQRLCPLTDDNQERANHYYSKHSSYGKSTYSPSTHMPRWASRIRLEIEEVRVEQVQAILPPDVHAEGVERQHVAKYMGHGIHHDDAHALAFAELWDTNNGKREGCSWESNPFVWVVTFKRVEH